MKEYIQHNTESTVTHEQEPRYPMLTAHQPVLNFHPGLIAKLSESDVFVVHDGDTLEEKGAMSIQIPAGEGTKTVPLYKGGSENPNLFATQVEYKGLKESKLPDKLISFLGGSVNKGVIRQIRKRAEELDNFFPPGQVVVARRNTELLSHMLPDLGVQVPQFVYLSDILQQPKVKDMLQDTLEQFEPDEYWAWGNNNERKKVEDKDHAAELAKQGKLIPKAVPLSHLLHSLSREMNMGLVGGLGQQQYESEARSNGIQFPRLVARKTITSKQGLEISQSQDGRYLPQNANSLTLPNGYRPSAMVMWLVGEKFDFNQIECINH